MAGGISERSTHDVQSSVDPLQSGKFKVKLDSQLQAEDSADNADGLWSVKYNYKPPSASFSKSEISIASDDKDDTERINLVLGGNATQDKQYDYAGQFSDDKCTFALRFDETSQTCTLTPVRAKLAFNLRKAPDGSGVDESTLPSAHTHEFGEDSALSKGSSGRNISNPFDYRNYLDGLPVPTPSSKQPQSEKKGTTTSQQATQGPSSLASASRMQSSAKAKPMRKAPTKARTAKAQQDTSPKPARGERSGLQSKSETQLSTEKHDDSVLTIDFGDSTEHLNPRGQRGSTPTIRGGTPLGSGPRSLRSAAASANASPAFGPAKKSQVQFARSRESRGHRMADSTDDEVEHLNIGSPKMADDAENSSPTPGRPGLGDRKESMGGDEFEKALALAIQSENESNEDEGVAVPANTRPEPESEEESEEE